jgi:broad specificity phosphatase PhoE
VARLSRHSVRRCRRTARGIGLLSRPDAGRRLVVWRHGRTEWNADGRFQGQLDPPLDTTGQLQAKAAASVLANFDPVSIVSSDADRARATAGVLAEMVAAPVRTDPRLREIALGGWEGLSRAEVRRRFPVEYAGWLAGDDIRRGGGETYAEVGVRVAAALADVLATAPAEQTVVAVTHGGAARAIFGVLMGLPAEHWWRMGPLGNARWSVLVAATGGWRLAEHNVGTETPAA